MSNPQLMGFEDTAVYVGAGIDVLPILLFRNIRTFIYIDMYPRNTFNNVINDHKYISKMENDFYKTIRGIGFYKIHKKDSTTPNLYEYLHNSRTTQVLYFFNNEFPNNMDKIALDYIRKASILICCGHNPHKSILDFMKPGPKYFIGNNKSRYLSAEALKRKFYYDFKNELAPINEYMYYMKSDIRDINGVCERIHRQPSIIKEYYRFDIPENYAYWLSEYVEESHIVKMPVTKYISIEQLYTTGNCGKHLRVIK